MAKAGGKSITWPFLKEAKTRADSAYQEPKFAERWLIEQLVAGNLPWRSDTLEGSKRDCDPGSGDPEFWREPPLTFPPPGPVAILQTRGLRVSWDESWARRRWSHSDSYTYYRIEVAGDRLTELLPAPPPRQEKTLKRKWRLDELAPVVDEMFPGGPPRDKPTVELVQRLGNELERRGIRVSEATMQRALGRRR